MLRLGLRGAGGMTENKQAHTHRQTKQTSTTIKTNKQNTKHVLEENHVTRRDVPKNWQSRALHLVKGNTTLEEGKMGGMISSCSGHHGRGWR